MTRKSVSHESSPKHIYSKFHPYISLLNVKYQRKMCIITLVLSEANRDLQIDKQQHDHWELSLLPGYGPTQKQHETIINQLNHKSKPGCNPRWVEKASSETCQYYHISFLQLQSQNLLLDHPQYRRQTFHS